MNAGIIGAGITGLAAAYELSKNNIKVKILEAADNVGGIGGVINFDGAFIEKYYHHFFKSDKYIIGLIKELRLEEEMMWLNSNMGYFIDDCLYDFGTPVSLLKFKPLSFVDKMRFGMAILKIMSISDYRALENITAHDWIKKHAGSVVYDKVWKPLLITKFGDKYKDISMAWFWGKIKLRGSSKEKGREVLGYINGSNLSLFERLSHELEKRGSEIILNCSVSSIEKGKNFCMRTGCGSFYFDKVISTVPLPVFLNIGKRVLPGKYIEEKRNIDYTSVVCMILSLNKPFTKYYWLNIGDEEIPFGGLIEHTNLLDAGQYNNNHILYISNYLYKDSLYYSMGSDELLNAYMKYLKKVNPSFDETWVNKVFVFKDEYAQPIVERLYSSVKPGFNTPVPGLYTASMCNIYPEDRGMNYAVRDGIEAARLLLEEA